MNCKYIYLSLLLVFFASISFAQTGKGSVADVAFIQGNWKATTPDGRTIEGSWLPPKGENMLGFMRMMKGDKPDLYEILAYEQTDKGLTSMVKHFQPGLIANEEKDKQDRYVFIEASKNRAVFEKEGEATLRILYEKRSHNQFVIARGSQKDGQWVFEDLFVFNRMK